jgi:hypothetical protein
LRTPSGHLRSASESDVRCIPRPQRRKASEAVARLLKSDVAHRFVIDMATP